jgi:TniQ protein
MSMMVPSAFSVRILSPWREGQETFQESDIPAHSRLYRLEPQALGSLWQESLTSYLNRLGWTHHVSPRAMVVQEIIPYLNKTQARSRQWIGALSRGSAMNINGTGLLALEWSQALEQLTLCPDLHLLTLHGWMGNLSSQGHLHTCPVWCPMCYAEWREQEACIYQPLVWFLKVITTCPTHNRLLESHCPHCQKNQSVITLGTRPGHCTQCNRWLGIPPDEELPHKRDEESTQWQQWVFQTLEELRAASTTGRTLQWETCFTHLGADCVSAVDLVTWEQVERFTGVKRYILHQWFKQRWIPSRETILQLCYVCEVTPLQIMNGEITSLVEVITHDTPSRPPVRRRARPKVDPERSLELIHAILDGREKPLSLTQRCKRLGYGHRTLKYLFPEECAQIVQQAQVYRKQQDKQRMAKTREQVRQAVFSLNTQGIDPSLHKVQSFLSAGVMRQAEAREIWHATLRELGLEPRNPRKTQVGPAQNSG